MKAFLFLILLYLADVNSQEVGSDGTCFVPVTCLGSEGQHHSTVEWRELTTSKCEECTAPCPATSATLEPTGESAEGVAAIAKVLEEQNATISKLTETIRRLEAKQGRVRYSPADWTRASNGLFYKYFSENVDHETAKSNCAVFGGRLASAGIRTVEIKREIIELLPNPYPHVWIGLDDLVSQGNYVWSDGVKSTGANTDWANEGNDSNEHCVAMVSAYNGQYVDLLCERIISYICEL